MPSWRRTENPKLSKYFSGKELACRCCLCSPQLMNDHFLGMLDALREEYGAPVVVTSAYRCERHQDVLRRNGLETAKGRSSHQDGIAADITGVGNFDVEKLRAAALKVFANHSVGIANRFIHVDSRPGGPRRWTYK